MIDEYPAPCGDPRCPCDRTCAFDQAEEKSPGRHPDSQRFVDAKMAEIELHDRKQRDYGTDIDPFANIRRCERYDIPAWVGCAIRMADKMARIERAVGQWARGEEVAMSNESLLDSFDDLSVYATIGRVLYEDAS